MNSNKIFELINSSTILDLSQTFEEGMPVWFTHPRFYQNEVESLEKGDVSYLNQLIMGEHCGSHVDAQNHFIKNGYTIAEMKLDQLIGEGIVIDISNLPDNGVATVDIITSWEKSNKKIENNNIVFFYTGHDKYWSLKPNHTKFMSNWRGLSREGAEYLKNIGVKAVGTDAMSIDAFVNDGNPAHEVILGAGIPIIENIANLSKLFTQPFLFVALPLKIKNGSASPIRAIAVY